MVTDEIITETSLQTLPTLDKDSINDGKVEAINGRKGETPANPLSKRQQKKQRRLADYLLHKKERRLQEREKNKQKRQAAIAKGLPARVGLSRKELKKRQETASTTAKTLNVAIDLDYDEIMSERDIAKCIKQCLRMYTINRRSLQPAQIHLTGIKKDGRIHEILKKNDGWENWKMGFHFNTKHTELSPNDRLIYLTSESDSVLENLKSENLYVIGGLVDHNHQKGLCHGRAVSDNLKTARLPLSEYVDMKTRSVLSTYHVFEILLRVSEGKSWSEAILETLPMRKGAIPKPISQSQSTPIELQKEASTSVPEVVMDISNPSEAT